VLELIPQSYVSSLDLRTVFGRNAPLHVDLGCGDGSFLAALAQQNPDRNFLGVERLAGRVCSTSRKIAGLNNARIIQIETSYAVRYLLPPNSVEAFYLLFPDPWPKRRHHRRRLLNDEFLANVAEALSDRGIIHIATDHADYFNEIRCVAQQSENFKASVVPSQSDFPQSAFEKQFRQAGAKIYRLALRKSPLRSLEARDGSSPTPS
jgi:tRNA (guanine-N7-)-methyltransferase